MAITYIEYDTSYSDNNLEEAVDYLSDIMLDIFLFAKALRLERIQQKLALEYHNMIYWVVIRAIFNVIQYGFYRKAIFPKSGFIGRAGKIKKGE